MTLTLHGQAALVSLTQLPVAAAAAAAAIRLQAGWCCFQWAAWQALLHNPQAAGDSSNINVFATPACPARLVPCRLHSSF
jgi:hypothetical protein